MSHGLHNHTAAPAVLPPDKAKILKIWKTAGLLAFVTGIEFLLAFTVTRGNFLIVLFVVLTLVKAFYIIADFMHLKYEVKSFIWTITIPVILVIWLVVALLVEGAAIYHMRNLWGWF
jgi:cytochrome c oxidase subunit 4